MCYQFFHPLEYNNRNKRQAIPDNIIQQSRAETTCYQTHSYETTKLANADATKIWSNDKRHAFGTDEKQSTVKNEFI